MTPALALFAWIGIRGWAAWDELVLDYDVAPQVIEKAKPAYPEEARRRGLEGTVVAEIALDRHGRVETVVVVKSIPALDDAAMQSLCRWRFAPATRRGAPVRTKALAPVRFSLDGDDAIRGGLVGGFGDGGGPFMICPR